MPYTKTSWVDGSAPAISASNLNKIENGIYDSLRQDGTTAMSGQLVVTSGSATTPSIAASGDSNTGLFFPTSDNVALAVGGGEGFRLLANGNVGLSQANPSVKLALGNATGQKLNLYDDPAAGIGVGFGIDISGVGSYETTFYSKSNAGGNGQWVFGHLDSSNTFTEKMRLNSSGNLGIGTTSFNLGSYDASSKFLELQSSKYPVIELASTDTVANNKILGVVGFMNNGTGVASKSSAQIVSLQDGTDGTSPGGRLEFYTRADAGSLTERIRITSAGNVGIGTSSPTNKLHVTDLALFSKTNNGPNELIGTFIGSDGTYPVLDMRRWTGSGTDHGTGKISTTDTADMLFFTTQAASNTTATNERMRLTYNGYLLIGYTSSNGAYPLQVNGQIFATSATIATSDKNYKENIKPLTDALAIVNALNPVSFDWKEHPVHNFDRTQPTIGFIAQEVAEVLKDKPYLDSLVKKSVCEWETETGETVDREVTREVTREIVEEVDGEEVTRTITEEVTEVVLEEVKEKHTEEFYGIAESNLIAILTKAVQELSDKVKFLESKIK